MPFLAKGGDELGSPSHRNRLSYGHQGVWQELLNDVRGDLYRFFVLQSQFQVVTRSKAMFEMLRRAETFELAIDHDRQSRAENITFCHRMRGEENGSIFFLRFDQIVPDDTTISRI